MTEPYRFGRRAYTCCSIAIHFARPKATRCQPVSNMQVSLHIVACSCRSRAALAACTSNPVDDATADDRARRGRGVSPGDTAAGGSRPPAGRSRDVRGVRCGDRIVGGARPGKGRSGGGHRDARRRAWPAPLPLPGAATAMTGDNRGHVYASTRGGYFRVDIADGLVTRVEVDGQGDTDFTAIARRADGKLVLGSADGAVYTLSSDTAVGAAAEDLRARGCACHPREYGCGSGPRPDLGDHRRRQRREGRTRAARR